MSKVEAMAEAPTPVGGTMFITRDALTDGIRTGRVETAAESGAAWTWVDVVPNRIGHLTIRTMVKGTDCHSTIEAARARVKRLARLRLKKIAKERVRLEAIASGALHVKEPR